VLECIKEVACNTGVAFYSHASPFYQAYRGQCLCYSGSFVCSKPPKGKIREESFKYYSNVGLLSVVLIVREEQNQALLSILYYCVPGLHKSVLNI